MGAARKSRPQEEAAQAITTGAFHHEDTLVMVATGHRFRSLRSLSNSGSNAYFGREEFQ